MKGENSEDMRPRHRWKDIITVDDYILSPHSNVPWRTFMLVSAVTNLSFINSGDFIDQLSDYQLHKKGSASLR
jgi:hypothetical protein